MKKDAACAPRRGVTSAPEPSRCGARAFLPVPAGRGTMRCGRDSASHARCQAALGPTRIPLECPRGVASASDADESFAAAERDAKVLREGRGAS